MDAFTTESTETTETRENGEAARQRLSFRGWFLLCPARHILTALGGLVIGLYFLLRRRPAVMDAVNRCFVSPWRLFWRRATSFLPFSLAEALIVGGILALLVYSCRFVAGLATRPEKGKRLYRYLMTAVTALSLIYGGFCLLWGVYYFTADFEAQSGIVGAPLSVEQLKAVTWYFTDLVNDYGAQVARDGEGRFAEPMDRYFDAAPGLYHAAEKAVPCLKGDDVPAKRFFFSYFMSLADFTGFYFPFTAEANINIDSPGCLIPSTIAHELAHQRGVAEEDEANFVAVLASLESGDPVYCYSSCLLAYIHLGNALYKADRDAWAENYARLSEGVRADLAENNAYWAKFETPVSKVSNTVYTGFLQSHGQSLGLQTYGKCVDLLATYYYDAALAVYPPAD